MKKSLSFLVALAMVISSFASVASAATASEAGAKLQQLNVIKGDLEGNLMEDATWKKQDIAVLLARLSGAEAEAQATAKAHTFADVPAGYYDGFLSWASEKGYLTGESATTFGFGGTLTNQEFYAVVLRTLGVDTTGDNYAKTMELAATAGLVAADVDGKADAKRGDTYVAVVEALDTVVGNTGKTLGQTLNLPGYEVTALAIAKSEQTNTREITVSFNKEVTAAEKADLTFDVKNGLVAYTVTSKWADDNKSVVLSSNFLPAAEYDLTVKGFDARKVTIVDEKPTKIDITVNSLQKANGNDLGVKLYNQFGKEIANPTGLSTTVYNATQGKTIAANSGKYDLALDADAKVDDNFVVTVTHTSGVSATKSFKVVAGSAATNIQLGAVAPLKDKTRITSGESGLILPVTLVDQYGASIKLAETAEQTLAANVNTFTISGITFMLSQANVLDKYSVDKDGVFKFSVKAAGTLVINAVNPATGATGSTTIKIESAAAIKTLQLSNPGILVVEEEEVKVPYAAVDNFGGSVAAKDIKFSYAGTPAANEVSVNSNVAFATGYPKVNGKGELLFKFDAGTDLTAKTTAYVYAYVNGAQVGSLTVDVNPKAVQKHINGIKDVQVYLTPGASVDFDQDNITYLDSYNRTKNVAAATYSVVSADTSKVTYAGGKLTAVAEGTSEITVNFATGGTDDTDYKFTVTVVKAADVTSYGIKNINTIYGGQIAGADLTSGSAHAKTVELVGKLSNGTEVAIVQGNAFDFVTSTDVTKVAVNGKIIYGLAAGEVTIKAYKGSNVVAEQVVTVSEAAPIATKVAFNEAEYTLSGAVGSTLGFTVNSGTNKITVEDQYGVALTTTGYLTSGDADVATVTPVTSLDVTKVAVGQVTITYTTTNGVSATAVVVVN